MTAYQLMVLRFLQAQRDFPHLNHDGHGPTPTAGNLGLEVEGLFSGLRVWEGNYIARAQREEAEREFRRTG